MIGVLQFVLLKLRFDSRLRRQLQKLAHIGACHIRHRLLISFSIHNCDG